jgi:hypothetical protein
MVHKTRHVLAIVAMTSAALVFRVPTGAALGNNVCPHGANPSSTACYFVLFQVHYGTYAEWHSGTLYVSDDQIAAGGHTNFSIWSYSQYSGSHDWVEEGETKGYHGDGNYRWYYAKVNYNGQYSDYASSVTSADGVNHAYRLVYQGTAFDGSGVYSIRRDGVELNYFAGLGYGSDTSQAGLEASGTDGNYLADSITGYPLAYQDTSYNYHYGWDTSEYWIDAACGFGQSPPNCFTGSFPGGSNINWSASKPLF